MKKVFFFLFIFLPFISSAQIIYVCTGFADLFKVDLSNCSATLIGNTVFPMEDIALSPSGVLYGTDGTNLFTISTTNASTTPTPGVNAMTDFSVALVCDDAGNIYGGGSLLTKLDWQTGNWNTLGSFSPYFAGGDLTFYNGNLYLAEATQLLIEITVSPFSMQNNGTMVSNTSIFGVITSGHPVYDPCTGILVSGDSTRMFATGGNQIFLVNPPNAGITPFCTLPLQSGDILYGAASPDESQSIVVATTIPETPLPNVFSPNGDGKNDFFIPAKGDTGLCGVTGSFEVYNRWGNEIFSGDLLQSWDGKTKDGKECSEGVYYYILHRQTPSVPMITTTGFVSLFR
jgi:gliding motility-associated-like protein